MKAICTSIREKCFASPIGKRISAEPDSLADYPVKSNDAVRQKNPLADEKSALLAGLKRKRAHPGSKVEHQY